MCETKIVLFVPLGECEDGCVGLGLARRDEVVFSRQRSDGSVVGDRLLVLGLRRPPAPYRKAIPQRSGLGDLGIFRLTQ